MLLKVLQWGKALSNPHDVISGGDKVADKQEAGKGSKLEIKDEEIKIQILVYSNNRCQS